ncbi:4363_t:CDS:2, partial [Entrophospora sp. SA101]
DVGNFTYGPGHPMKPHRMRMTHDLVINYNLFRKMEILTPKRASPRQMTRFHTDEYIDFLYRVTPLNVEELSQQQTRYVPPSIYDTDYEEEEEDPDIRMSQNEYSDSDDEIGRRNERCYHPNGNNPL